MKSCLLTLLALSVTTLGQASIHAYFNQNPHNSYTEAYRGITRPGDNLEEVLIEEIRLAKKYIYIAVQELRLPLIASALIEKSQEGVDVRVILEHDYNFTVLTQRDSDNENEYEATKLAELKAFVDVNRDGRISQHELETRDAIYMLRQAKIPIMDDTFDNSRGSGLMHHKFVLIDGKTTIVSSANFTMSCFHGDILAPYSRGNANSMVVVKSVSLTKIFLVEYAQLWGNGRRGNFGHKKTYRGPQTVSVRGSKITVQFSPTTARYHWDESVNGLIGLHLNKATKSIHGALFVFSDQKMANVIERRYEAGVDIGFLIEPKFAYREYSELLDMLGLRMLSPKCSYEADNNPWKTRATELGIALLPRGDVLHHKFAVIDSKTVVIGSQNWSESANHVNDETLLVIQSPAISDLYGQEYERLKRRSRLGAPSWLVSEIRHLEATCANDGFYY